MQMVASQSKAGTDRVVGDSRRRGFCRCGAWQSGTLPSLREKPSSRSTSRSVWSSRGCARRTIARVPLDEHALSASTDGALERPPSGRPRVVVRNRGRCDGRGVGDRGTAAVWRIRRRKCRVLREQGARTFERGAPAGAQEAVPADLREPARQDVLEKAREKTVNRQRHGARLAGGRVRVPKGDAPVGEAGEPLIGQPDAIDVAREIERRLCARADLLDMDGPPTSPDARVDGGCHARAPKRAPHVRAENGGEDVARNEKARVRGHAPRLPVGSEPAGRNEEVGMRMILERAGPRVEDGEDPDGATDPRAIVGQGLHRGGGFA